MRSLFWPLALIWLSGHSYAAEHGVVLLYHHVSETTPALTSVTPEQFENHLNYLAENDFNVMPLTELLDAIASGEQLPERAIAITFDDALASIYTNAFPLLKQHDWPFSVFVSSASKDLNYGGYMSWDELADMRGYRAEIGSHTESHDHLARRLESETDDEWNRRIIAEIDVGNQRLEEELGVKVRTFAYPYGEYNDEIKALVRERNLYGLAQQSGAVGRLTDLTQIPRYPMLGGFADLDRFALVANSRPLPAAEVLAGAGIRAVGEAAGDLRIRMLGGDYNSAQLSCFSSSGSRLVTSWESPWLRVSLPEFRPGRNKVNCTAPSSSESGVYYWFSQQWLVKSANGEWPSE